MQRWVILLECPTVFRFSWRKKTWCGSTSSGLLLHYYYYYFQKWHLFERLFSTFYFSLTIPTSLCTEQNKPVVSFSCGSSVVCEELIVQASVYRWEGDRTGRDSPDCGNSILRTVAEWRLVRGGKWSMSYGGSGGSWTVMNSWISQFKSVTSFWYSCLSWSKWDRVQGLAHFDLGTIIFVQVRT